MSQTSYSQSMAVAQAGMKAGAGDDYVESFLAQVALGFGLAVIAGTDLARQVTLAAAAGGVFRGVSLHTQAIEQGYPPPQTGPVKYPIGMAVSVLRQGRLWVVTREAVTIDTPAFFDNGSAAAGVNSGKFSMVDDGSTDAVPTGIFRSTNTGAGLAVLEIMIP